MMTGVGPKKQLLYFSDEIWFKSHQPLHNVSCNIKTTLSWTI